MTRSDKPTGKGYGKPPKAYRFPPGKSGNPGGRPKKTRITTIEEALGAELSETVTVTINGKSQKISLAELVAKQAVARAAKGDDKAIATVSRLAPKKTEPSELSKISGGYERLAQKMRLIMERRQRNNPDGKDEDRGNSE